MAVVDSMSLSESLTELKRLYEETNKVETRVQKLLQEGRPESIDYVEPDKELCTMKWNILFLANAELYSHRNRIIAQKLQQIYELGFRRGYRAAKAGDMPLYCTDEEEEQYWREVEENQRNREEKSTGKE